MLYTYTPSQKFELVRISVLRDIKKKVKRIDQRQSVRYVSEAGTAILEIQVKIHAII